MIHRYYIITVSLLILLFIVMPLQAGSQKPRFDNFTPLISDIQSQILATPNSGFVPSTESELREWVTIFQSFQSHSLDSCKMLLEKFNYTLIQLKDNQTGSAYDVIKEKEPVQRGWGTFIYNRNHSKKLFIHITHPVDDPNVLAIGVELFRRTQAEWLLIAGTGKRAGGDKISSDIARAPRSVFQTWHQLLTDANHIAVSLHGFNQPYYKYPITTTDIVLSNGSTTDEQWGISQISLAFRDSLKYAGFYSSVAMYDSGYNALAASGNPQATFSNDNLGFGHWINIELSDALRANPSAVSRFIASADHALDVVNKKISKQNKAFGLVSPRVVHIDSAHKILFAPPSAQTYRIISFNAGNSRNDTINIRAGNWIGLFGSDKSMARISEIDSSEKNILQEFARARRSGTHTTVASIIDPSLSTMSAVLRHSRKMINDSTFTNEEKKEEPLQVRRIPLSQYGVSDIADRMLPEVTTYRWEGVISERLNPAIQMFQIGNFQSGFRDENEMQNFLIPIISNSYHDGRSKFLGIQMTRVLVQEIARLVTEQHHPDTDVSLLAEESENGDYYLRIFPNNQPKELADLKR